MKTLHKYLFIVLYIYIYIYIYIYQIEHNVFSFPQGDQMIDPDFWLTKSQTQLYFYTPFIV